MNKSLLFEILRQPTAPYRESHVIRAVTRQLDSANVPWFRDPIGNIVVGVKDEAQYFARLNKKLKEPVRIFIAHLDHPGLHGMRWISRNRLEVRWLGGSPKERLSGARVWLADDTGLVGEGTLEKPVVNRSGSALASARVKVSETSDWSAKHPRSLFGGFRFQEPVWAEGDVIYTKAADDLVGCAVITQLAMSRYQKKSLKSEREGFLGLLTRAEEVGFIGAIGHFDLGWLQKAKRSVRCVSLETSRALSGAEVGKGPVVRLGDRATTFDAGSLEVLSAVARRKLPKRHQRRIMDGGTCEATVAMAYGFRALGISVPLGNYHNQSFEGGPDSRGANGPAPEFVHFEDIKGMRTLCEALLSPSLNWEDPYATKVKEFRKWKHGAASLLKLA